MPSTRPLKIMVDMRWVRQGGVDGISRFTLSIVAEWLRGDAPHHFFLLFADPASADMYMNSLRRYDERPLLASHHVVETGLPAVSLRNLTALPALVREAAPDIFFSPYYLFYPLPATCLRIATVHDLIPLRFPELYQANWLFRLLLCRRWPLQRLLRACDRIVTVSQNSRQDLIDLLDLPAERICAIPLGVNMHQPAGERLAILEQYGLPPGKQYILSVSRTEPYKNLISLIQAYSLCPPAIRQAYPLVLVGPAHPVQARQLEAEIASLGLDGEVWLTGPVQAEELPVLYLQSILLVFPSLYEGFGLPVLEAMAHGVPVIASNRASLPEVVGEAGILVDPLDTQQLAARMQALLEDPQAQQRLSMAGLARASQFTWEKTAQQLLQQLLDWRIIA